MAGRNACRRLFRACQDWLRPHLERWYASRSFGHRGERAAEKYLRRKGYVIVGRGIRSTLGELDLVAVDGRTIVFVEVKTRKSAAVGHPAESVTEWKQTRITRAALMFLKRNHLTECKARFDVVTVTWPNPKARPTIEHFIHAFEPTGNYELYG
jgi:putative endonuclease